MNAKFELQFRSPEFQIHFSIQHSAFKIAFYGFIPGRHSGLYPEFANHKIGFSIERIESVMCAKSMDRISSDGW